MKKIYICHTIYHLLISLLKEGKNENGNNAVVYILMKTIADWRNLSNTLKDLGYNVIVLDDNDFIYSIFKRKYKQMHSKKRIEELSNEDRSVFYIYNDNTRIGEYINREKIHYNLIEDGYNALASKLLNYPIKIRTKLKNLILNIPISRGWSKYCKTIEVNDKSIMPKDERWNKIIEIPRSSLFKADNEFKNKILNIFNVSRATSNKNKKLLLLTQPLGGDVGVDNEINSIEKQVQYYHKIVEKYKFDYEIYLKQHPRDAADYSNFSDVLFLEKNIPMEVYEFIGGYHFDLGITHSSTALNFLTCVDEKIILNKSNL